MKGCGILSIAFGSNVCESTQLQILDVPNALTPAQADPDLFLVVMQVPFGEFFEDVTDHGQAVTRILGYSVEEFKLRI